jgi:hypothetical protein
LKSRQLVEYKLGMNFYMANDIDNPKAGREKLRECLLKEEGVLAAYTREQIMSGAFPATPWTKNLATYYFPSRGPDAIAILRPYWNTKNEDTLLHETPWAYDSWVPLAFYGPGIKAQKVARRVSVLNLAPTLSILLNSKRPSGSMDDLLPELIPTN